MNAIRVEDEVELAHVTEASIERLHKHLYEVEYAELALTVVDRHDEVECGVVSVDEFDALAPVRRVFEEVADRVGTLGHELEGVADYVVARGVGLGEGGKGGGRGGVTERGWDRERDRGE